MTVLFNDIVFLCFIPLPTFRLGGCVLRVTLDRSIGEYQRIDRSGKLGKHVGKD